MQLSASSVDLRSKRFFSLVASSGRVAPGLVVAWWWSVTSHPLLNAESSEAPWPTRDGVPNQLASPVAVARIRQCRICLRVLQCSPCHILEQAMREEMGQAEISYLLFALSSAMRVRPQDVSDDHTDFEEERAKQLSTCGRPFSPFTQLPGEQPDKGSAGPMRRCTMDDRNHPPRFFPAPGWPYTGMYDCLPVERKMITPSWHGGSTPCDALGASRCGED